MVKKHSKRPVTQTKKTEPTSSDKDWIIWAAWADRVTFDEIYERTGLSEPEVIAHLRRQLQPTSFRRWRKRVSSRKTKHRKRFALSRQQLHPKYPQRFKE